MEVRVPPLPIQYCCLLLRRTVVSGGILLRKGESCAVKAFLKWGAMGGILLLAFIEE